MKLEKITREFIKALTESQKKRTEAYDSKGVVTRVEEGIAWVKLAGSKIETPLQMTISAEPGDEVQARIGNGTGWLVGNGTAPPTDNKVANRSYRVAVTAEEKANTAAAAAEIATEAALSAQEDADRAKTAADEAQESADNASVYASRALGNLSTVQSVAETLAWITQHGTMTLTSDTEPVPSHIYFIQDAEGDYTVNNVNYSIVSEPDPNSMSLYYELTIDESLNNYVETHLALTDEGLWLLPAALGGYKVLVATGAGTVHTEAGIYIIDAGGTTVAKFVADMAQIGVSADSHMEITATAIRGVLESGQNYFQFSNEDTVFTEAFFGVLYYDDASSFPITPTKYTAPVNFVNGATITLYYGFAQGSAYIQTFTAGSGSSKRVSIGNHYYRISYDGKNTFTYYAESRDASSNDLYWRIEANSRVVAPAYIIGSGKATGRFATCIGHGNVAAGDYQTVAGKFNSNSSANAFEIGNGTGYTARRNAMTVDWNGNETIAGTLTQNSDKRLKEHVEYLEEDAAEFISKLKPAHYIKDGNDHVGFYAQDVAMVDPWKCMTGKMNGYMTLGYTELIAPLVAYCQSLERRITELEKGE